MVRDRQPRHRPFSLMDFRLIMIATKVPRKKLRKVAKKALKAAEEEFGRAEDVLAEKNEQLTRVQEENKRIREYIDAVKQEEILAVVTA